MPASFPELEKARSNARKSSILEKKIPIMAQLTVSKKSRGSFSFLVQENITVNEVFEIQEPIKGYLMDSDEES